MISTHGGRQLDSVPAPLDCIAPMRDAVGNSMELILDGGVRRAVHVLKALALGADAVSFGRPYLFGLASGGEKGVSRVLGLLLHALRRDLLLLGCRNIADIGPHHVRRVMGR